MKSRKLFISSALALSTMFGSVTAMMNTMPISATTVTVDDFEGTHSFKAFQIFTGKLEDNKLVDIEWGTGVNADRLKAALIAEDSPLKSKMENAGITADSNAAAVADALDSLEEADSLKLAKIVSGCLNGDGTEISDKTTDLAPGYYLIKDVTALEAGADDVIGLSILQVGNDAVTIKPKNAKPSVDKQVEDNDGHDGITDAGFGETADHEIGETFKFKLTATINKYADIKNYETYKLVFHDSWSEGITYDTEFTPTVEVIKGDETTAAATITDASVNTTSPEGNDKLTVTINDLLAKLDGLNLTDNDKLTVEVTYQAKLTDAAVVAQNNVAGAQNNNNVYLEYSNNPNAEGTGQTEKDYVFVFTYELNNMKKDNTGKTLKGAEFVLKKGDQFATFTDGKLTGWVDSQEAATKITSGDDGTFKMIGLDAGTYTLVETAAPEGYKAGADIEVTIASNHAEEEGGTTAKAEFTVNGEKAGGVEVINSKISSLPETGGIGTTVLYTVGGILVIGAGVALTAGKKAKREESED